MKEPKPEKANILPDKVKSEVKPIRYERPIERPKPTPNPSKKK
ncbi:MAG: hypothetical protein WA126_14005 [Thermodesulfovibrionales bacterium]